jgi:beta-lactam-binding protein with PASTA domain
MLTALRRLGIVLAIGVAFVFGLATTVYLSLRSPEVTVPEVVGKDRFAAENDLQAAGLNFRVRATRPSKQVKADTVMFQLPRAGEVVKKGQTVAVDIARVPKEGEASEAVSAPDNTNANDNENANQPSNTNENKPKRNRNANANANNANGNSNSANRNANRANANAKANANSGNTNFFPRPANANRSPQTDNGNANRANKNVNRAPTPAKPATAAPTPGRR